MAVSPLFVKYLKKPGLLLLLKERMEKKKVIIVPSLGGCSINLDDVTFFRFERPRDKRTYQFFVHENCLFEIQVLRDGNPRCWFLGNSIVEDGSLYVATPIHPLLLLLPLIDQARFAGRELGEDSKGFFVSEEDLFDEDTTDVSHILACVDTNLDLLCDSKCAFDTTHYRLNEEKALNWLKGITQQLTLFFKEKINQEERQLKLALSVMYEYTNEMWFGLLCGLFR